MDQRGTGLKPVETWTLPDSTVTTLPWWDYLYRVNASGFFPRRVYSLVFEIASRSTPTASPAITPSGDGFSPAKP
jgi:hypothetical protein